ncbi:MAG: hypothetical protein C5S40_07040 [ANME-2 cluster archaeon]|nr:hypothetical protein [ANME-2 cluster archaeon]
MNNKRKAISSAQNVALVTQVNRVCPICDAPLFYTKNGSSYKQYEIAHIYPLNPKTDEIQLLESEERLNEDVNHENNLIPLCTRCHVKFDKPRTVREYKNLVKIKKLLIKKKEQQDLWHQYQIEDDISKVIESLYTEDISNGECDIDFVLKKVDRKLNDSISKPTKRKIKNNVADYYILIRNKFKSIDGIHPDSANLISTQIKSYYLKQKTLESSQQEIFANIVDWIHAKTHPETDDAAEIITSFFIQNCEIFE